MSQFTRRGIVAAAPVLAVSTPSIAKTRARGAFTHGVASGDPTSQSVILWTRFVPEDGRTCRIGWEVADDESFQRIVRRGEAVASAARDWCVKVDASGLPSGRSFAYRFLAQTPSITGLTRTAPARGDAPLRLALFSCSNLPFGHFTVYGHAAARADIDLCVHVGDYIYEYQRGKYPGATEAVPGRVIEPEGEIITWNDYHRRYQSYRADPDLQELHRVKPWITVWDDHELANDTWKDGAEEHNPEKEGDWVMRRLSAAQAYDDWMPIRTGTNVLKTYRAFRWGDMIDLFALDTRSIGRDQQLDYRRALARAASEGSPALIAAAEAFRSGPLAQADRSILGAVQEAWLTQGMRRSKARGATWQVLAQQVILGRQAFAPSMVSMLPDETSSFTKQWAALGAQLGQLGMDWNLDAWGGYPAARERLLQIAAAHGVNVLSLAGDSHNAWVNNLRGARTDGRMSVIEVAGTSVSSPGFERTFRKAEPGAREAAMRAANPELAWCDLTNRGYAAIALTRNEVRTEMVAVDQIRDRARAAFSTTLLRAEASAQGASGFSAA
jgi:alkaline phosphatase D